MKLINVAIHGRKQNVLTSAGSVGSNVSSDCGVVIMELVLSTVSWTKIKENFARKNHKFLNENKRLINKKKVDLTLNVLD